MANSQSAAVRKEQSFETSSPANAEKIASTFLTSLENSYHNQWPYDYWIMESVLPEEIVVALTTMPMPPAQGISYDGTRECYMGSRRYLNPETQAQFQFCSEISKALKDERIIRKLTDMTGRDMSEGQLRLEYAQDTDGFWLEPHVDIKPKLFSMLVYLSGEPELADAGTDIYDGPPNHTKVAMAPYKRNNAYFFTPSHNTWHGFAKRKINGTRKSLIINYVTKDWRNVGELA